jgi:hypothetical protein
LLLRRINCLDGITTVPGGYDEERNSDEGGRWCILCRIGYVWRCVCGITQYEGHACVPSTTADAARLDYGTTYGPYNTNTSNIASVNCPLALNMDDGPVQRIVVAYYNRNATTPLACTAYVLDTVGNVVYGLSQTSPTASTSAQSFSWFLSPTLSGPVYVYCAIPPKVATGGMNSHITFISAIQ